MIGRGTRTFESCRFPERLPDGKKENFLIIDFWQNNFDKEPDSGLSQSLPVQVVVFNTRLTILETLLPDQTAPQAQRLIQVLRDQIGQIPRDTYAVKQAWPRIEAVWQEGFWLYLTQAKLDLLRLQVGPLLRYVPGVDVAAATFTSKVERLKLQLLTGSGARQTAQAIAEDVSSLPEFVYENPQSEPAQAFRFGLNPQQLLRASPAQLDHLIEHLADLMKRRSNRLDNFLTLDLLDNIDNRGYVIITTVNNRPVYEEEYRAQVDRHILDVVAAHPAIRAIEAGQPVSDEALLDLERTLYRQLGQSEWQLSPETIRRAYHLKVTNLLAFVRHLFELEDLPDYDMVVKRQFQAFIDSQPFNSNQLRFLRAMQGVFLKKRKLHTADLYESPFDNFGADAVERWFSEAQVAQMLAFVERLAIE
jgi:type I restriction enzyme R subunit